MERHECDRLECSCSCSCLIEQSALDGSALDGSALDGSAQIGRWRARSSQRVWLLGEARSGEPPAGDDDDISPKTTRMLFKLMDLASAVVIFYLGMFGLSTTFRSQRTRGDFCHRTRGDGPQRTDKNPFNRRSLISNTPKIRQGSFCRKVTMYLHLISATKPRTSVAKMLPAVEGMGEQRTRRQFFR